MNVSSKDDAEPAARYFADVARQVFDQYFEKLGARHSRRLRDDAVRYDSDSWFVEVIYQAEDGPNYSPRVLVGCLEEMYEDLRRNRIDVMHTVPDGEEERSYNLTWKYRNRLELENALKSVRDKIVDKYSRPYLADSKRLRSLITERNGVIEAQGADEIDRHNASIFRSKAEAAFQRKEFAAAVQFYEQIPATKLTDMDRTRLHFAKARKS